MEPRLPVTVKAKKTPWPLSHNKGAEAEGAEGRSSEKERGEGAEGGGSSAATTTEQLVDAVHAVAETKGTSAEAREALGNLEAIAEKAGGGGEEVEEVIIADGKLAGGGGG